MKALALLPTVPFLAGGACGLSKVAQSAGAVTLVGDRATPEAASNLVKYFEDILVLGHGVSCEVTLQSERTFISYRDPSVRGTLPSGRKVCYADVNLDLLPGRNWYVTSCWTLDGLGRLAVESGALSYYGDKDEFIFIVNGDPCNFVSTAPFEAEGSGFPVLVSTGDPVMALQTRTERYLELIDSLSRSPRENDFILEHVLEYDMYIGGVYTRDGELITAESLIIPGE